MEKHSGDVWSSLLFSAGFLNPHITLNLYTTLYFYMGSNSLERVNWTLLNTNCQYRVIYTGHGTYVHIEGSAQRQIRMSCAKCVFHLFYSTGCMVDS